MVRSTAGSRSGTSVDGVVDGVRFAQTTQLRGVLSLEGRPAREQLVQDEAQGVDVAAGRRFAPSQLLGRHVRRSAAADIGRVQLLFRHRGEPEVHDSDFAVAVDHDVARLEIPVQDAPGVRGGQSCAQLPRDVDALIRSKRRMRLSRPARSSPSTYSIDR
jgi:hypothetical protein